MELTREQWLQNAVSFVRKTMMARDITIPPVKVSCSWPGGGDSQKRIGECWPRKASKAKINELFISPRLEDPAKVVSVLVHELAHAVDDCANGHKMPFVAIGMKMGLEGKPTQMSLSDETAAAWAAKLVAKHGAFPHRMLDKSKSPIKPQVARMIKLECGQCGAIWRMSQKHVDHVTCCPCCQSEDVTQEVKENADA